MFAKATSDIESGAGDEALVLVAELGQETSLSRTYAASESFFVWEDRDPNVEGDTWKIFAKRIENLARPDPDIVIDTNVFLQPPTGSMGCYLDLAGRYLVYQGADSRERDAPVKLMLLNLESPASGLELQRPGGTDARLRWPSISKSYVVWTEVQGFFQRRAWAQLLEDGSPVGAPFVMTQGNAGDSWITIHGNLAVWTGTAFQDNVPLSTGIILSELPLPGPDIGDVDQDGARTLSDAVSIFEFLFRGGWEPRRRLTDTNDDGKVDLDDPFVLLRFLFSGERRGALR